DRLLCSEAMVNSYKLRSGILNADEKERLYKAAERLRESSWLVQDAALQSMLKISAIARKEKLRRGIRLLLVDYLQLIEPDDRRAARHEQVAAIARRLKHLARELQIPVLALCQLNRQVEGRADHRPRLFDLRESGGIEQDADTVMLLHRPDEPTGSGEIIEVIIVKQRNGPAGVTTLLFRENFLRCEICTFEM